MSKHTDDDEVNAALENLEKWKQFENMEFTKRVEKEKWKPRERTAEDEEIDNCTFENLDLLIKTKNLEIMTLPEFKREVYLAQKLNERHYRLMKENEQEYCTFFMKTGACRYGNACKRIHIIPLCSETILIDHMYKDAFNKVKNVTKGLEDSLLEIDEEEMQKNYEEFYDDVFAEWSKFGKIVQFKACNNLMSHLRGNVYIQYENVEASILAKVHLDGRFYGGYPLKVNFSLIKDWKQAICAYNGPEMSSCPKFSECNFLHVYRNPRNEFPLERRSPDRGGKPRRFDNNFRKKFSPPKDRRPVERYVRHERHERNERHERHERHRERSKERHEHRRHSRERDRDRKHHKRHSRSRSRSRDRKKKSHKKRSHSRERGRDKSRSRSKDNGDDKRKSKRHSKSKSKSRSPS